MVGVHLGRKVPVIQQMRYNRNRMVSHIARSKFSVPRCYRILPKTLYVASLVEKVGNNCCKELGIVRKIYRISYREYY